MRSSKQLGRLVASSMPPRAGSSSASALLASSRKRFQSTSPPRPIVSVPPPAPSPPMPRSQVMNLRSPSRRSDAPPPDPNDPRASSMPPDEPPPARSGTPLYLLGFFAFFGTLGFALNRRPRPRDFLDPNVYSDQTVLSTKRLDEDHVLVTLNLEDRSVGRFGLYATKKDGSVVRPSETLVQHLYVGQPDIQVERPYTPINNVPVDKTMQFVVKKVKGGEVGRMICSKKPTDKLKMRGPLSTCAIDTSKYDKIVMISTGTGVSPFLQMLARMPEVPKEEVVVAPPEKPILNSIFDRTGKVEDVAYTPPPARVPPEMVLLQAMPKPGKTDWLTTSGLLQPLRAKFGDRLSVQRYPQEGMSNATLKAAVSKGKGDKVLVLVCLPPRLMAPVCGPMTPTLGQGEVGGMLKLCGLTSDEVLKLE